MKAAFFIWLMVCVLAAIGGYAQTQPDPDLQYATPESISTPAPAPQVTEEARGPITTARLDELTDNDLYQAIDKYYRNKKMSSVEFLLSILLLAFAVLALTLEVGLIMRGKIESAGGIKLIIITLIIFSVIFLVVCGYGNDQIAPVVGLLGTIAGYLLGKNTTKTD